MAGVYNLRLSRGGVPVAALTNGFTVVEGGGANLVEQVLIPSVLRSGQAGTFQVEVANAGLNDTFTPVIWLSIPDGMSTTLDPVGQLQDVRRWLLDVQPKGCPFPTIPPETLVRIPIYYKAPSSVGSISVGLDIYAIPPVTDMWGGIVEDNTGGTCNTFGPFYLTWSDPNLKANYFLYGIMPEVIGYESFFSNPLIGEFGTAWDFQPVTWPTPPHLDEFFVCSGNWTKPGHAGARLCVQESASWIQVVQSLWNSSVGVETIHEPHVDGPGGTPFYREGSFSDNPQAPPETLKALAHLASLSPGGWAGYRFQAEVHASRRIPPGNPPPPKPLVEVAQNGLRWGYSLRVEVQPQERKENPVNLITSRDPNDKNGPPGYGAGHFVGPATTLSYTIHFENETNASAPAQTIEVTDLLDASLDLSTLELSEIAFGSHTITIPPDLNYYTTAVDLRPEGSNLVVKVEAGLNSDSRTAYLQIQSLDADTLLLPDDPLAGFLPPNDSSHRGEGHLSFLIRPKTDAPTGTQLRNVANITFDHNPPIATNQRDPHDPGAGTNPDKECPNTIDSGAPTSTVQPLPSQCGRTFFVNWAGQDETNGCGVADYDVYASTNATDFTLWLQSTRQTSAIYVGTLGQTYYFACRARDNVGNQEPMHLVPDTTTTIPTNAPVLAPVSSVVIDPGQSFSITNLVSGTPLGEWRFDLGPGAPSGVSIDPTNGIFRWMPDCRQGNTTNLITVWVTDSGRTNLADMVSFTVAVTKCVEPTLGSQVILAGDSGRVPINLISRTAMTNLEMTLVTTPSERLTNFIIEPIVPEICSTNVVPLSNALYRLSIGTCSNQWLIGTQQVAWLHFSAVSNQSSAFVNMELTDLAGREPDGTPVANFAPQAGRVVVVGQEPLLEAFIATNQECALLLYSLPGTTNMLSMSGDLTIPAVLWSVHSQVTMTNLYQLIQPVFTNSDRLFFRAQRRF